MSPDGLWGGAGATSAGGPSWKIAIPSPSPHPHGGTGVRSGAAALAWRGALDHRETKDVASRLTSRGRCIECDGKKSTWETTSLATQAWQVNPPRTGHARSGRRRPRGERLVHCQGPEDDPQEGALNRANLLAAAQPIVHARSAAMRDGPRHRCASLPTKPQKQNACNSSNLQA
jgi:hypothetical protein